MEDDVQLHGKDGKRFSGESFACGGRIKRSNEPKCHSFMWGSLCGRLQGCIKDFKG